MVKTPKEWFEEHKKAGGPIQSDYSNNGARQITFKDGGKVVLLATGHFIHKWANGKQLQCNPDGTHITVDLDGTRTTQDPHGNKVVQHKDGTKTSYLKTGEKIVRHLDGTRTQYDRHGYGTILSADGKIIGHVTAKADDPEPKKKSTTVKSPKSRCVGRDSRHGGARCGEKES